MHKETLLIPPIFLHSLLVVAAVERGHRDSESATAASESFVERKRVGSFDRLGSWFLQQDLQNKKKTSGSPCKGLMDFLLTIDSVSPPFIFKSITDMRAPSFCRGKKSAKFSS